VTEVLRSERVAEDAGWRLIIWLSFKADFPVAKPESYISKLLT